MDATLFAQIDKQIHHAASKFKTLQVAIDAPSLQLQYALKSEQRFHSASAGKLMTSVLIMRAVERGKTTLETKVTSILGTRRVEGLFLYKGIDYATKVTLEHLLSHTSGVNDYFAGKSNVKPTFVKSLLTNSNHFFTPDELIAYTRDHQSAVGRPNEKFFYSDTGYVLLGLVIETLYGKSFATVLKEELFTPLKMTNSCLCFYDEMFDADALAPLRVEGVDVHTFKSLSCDFSGGGLSTTAHDLSLFLRAMAQGALLTEYSLIQMRRFEHKFHLGMFYGLGLMQLRFEKFFFLLRGLPRLEGHLGVTGVHAWYDPQTFDTYVLNVGDTRDVPRSFRLLIKLVDMVKKAHKKSTHSTPQS
ncbi:MAG: hypothetical protein KU37_04905 [Sulfuricurvum sp. PC08-66]|nr:MAG: hypothetical protein KU37_04905 [Sulfuricurvum sp. PC08-66]